MKLEILTIGAAALGLVAIAEPARAMPVASLAPAASASSDIGTVHYVPCPRVRGGRQVYTYSEPSRTYVYRKGVYGPSRRVVIDRRYGGREAYIDHRGRRGYYGGREAYRERGRAMVGETYRGGPVTGRSIGRPEGGRSMERPGRPGGERGFAPGREQGAQQGRSVEAPRSGRSGAEPGGTMNRGSQRSAPQGGERTGPQSLPRGGGY